MRLGNIWRKHLITEKDGRIEDKFQQVGFLFCYIKEF